MGLVQVDRAPAVAASACLGQPARASYHRSVSGVILVESGQRVYLLDIYLVARLLSEGTLG
jgi:hypothetical protein